MLLFHKLQAFEIERTLNTPTNRKIVNFMTVLRSENEQNWIA